MAKDVSTEGADDAHSRYATDRIFSMVKRMSLGAVVALLVIACLLGGALVLSLFNTVPLRPAAFEPSPAPREPAKQWIRIDPKTHRFVDEVGRVRIFHGLNVIFKTPPFVPETEKWDWETSFSEQDAADLERWGFNVIRLGVLWSGTFPAQSGSPYPDYMRKIKRIVKHCQNHGIHVIIDFHSDVISRRYCGNGMPDWAVDDALKAMGQRPPIGNFPSPVVRAEPRAWQKILCGQLTEASSEPSLRCEL
eukprot:6209352-Pleurochrysis_carterae.AAC.1